MCLSDLPSKYYFLKRLILKAVDINVGPSDKVSNKYYGIRVKLAIRGFAKEICLVLVVQAIQKLQSQRVGVG
jgi:hypothetical protein